LAYVMSAEKENWGTYAEQRQAEGAERLVKQYAGCRWNGARVLFTYC
jgi:hypothetical protein